MNENLPVVETGNPKKKYQYRNYWKHTKNGKYYDAPPLEVLNLLFSYDANTGSFKRRFDMKSGVIEPREITYAINNGYKLVSITDSTGIDRMYLVHRLAYFMQTQNQIPMDMQIDHQDGNPSNNKFENFRMVSNKVNTRNQKVRSSNASGYVGVSWNKQYNKWRARIVIDGKDKYLGRYDSPEEAYQARLDYVGRYNLYHLDEAFSYRHLIQDIS